MHHEKATIVGTIRTLDYGMQDFINKRMKEMVPVGEVMGIGRSFHAPSVVPSGVCKFKH